MQLVDSYGKIGRRIAASVWDRGSAGIPTESTNLDPWDSDSEPPNKEHTWTGPTPPLLIYVADVQLDLHMGPEQLEQGISQKMLLISRVCSFNWFSLSGLSGKRST